MVAFDDGDSCQVRIASHYGFGDKCSCIDNHCSFIWTKTIVSCSETVSVPFEVEIVVEAAPAYDHAQITGIAVSHAMYELISAFTAK